MYEYMTSNMTEPLVPLWDCLSGTTYIQKE